MTRPAGRVRGVSKCRGSGRVGSFFFKMSRVGSGRVFFLKAHGSGRVKEFRNLAGRVGSGQHTSKFSRVGSGHLTRPDPTRPVRFDLNREKPCKVGPCICRIQAVLINMALLSRCISHAFPSEAVVFKMNFSFLSNISSIPFKIRRTEST